MTELFLIAHIADRGVAIEGGLVDSVVDIGEMVAVPRAPAAIRGLAALRSRVVTVIDTRVALGLPPTETPRRAVIARVDGHLYAFLVDSLEDVAPHERLPMTAGASLGSGWACEGRGIVDRDGEPLLIIDLAALIPGGLAAAA
ncbi:MAG: chemotaxis protein CheW [Sphingomonas sp.]|nr:MAG: chemotaxis protein CheW [Sphingomonas sp.]